MKISVIHNTYKYNPYIRESVILNLNALKYAGVDYQYIVFNDNGDINISEQVSDLDVEYHYSDHNFGKKMCSGGWVGAIPFLSGDLIHNIGQDDVFSSFFYEAVVNKFINYDCDLVYCNGFKTVENLEISGELVGPLVDLDYSEPRQVFNQWFGVANNMITKTNNYIPASGAVYRKELHDTIGPPDVETFRGVCDFEYWSRILFYNKKVEYIKTPCWLYRLSRYSSALEVLDNGTTWESANLMKEYSEKVKNKYQLLLENEK